MENQIIDLVEYKQPTSIFDKSTNINVDVNVTSLDDSIKKLQNEKIFYKLCLKFNIKVIDKKRLYNMSIEAMKHRSARILKIDDMYFAAKYMKI